MASFKNIASAMFEFMGETCPVVFLFRSKPYKLYLACHGTTGQGQVAVQACCR